MDTFLRDAKYALRSLVRAPGFALAAVLALALGIGATSAIFGAVNALLLHPLPFAEPDSLVWVGNARRDVEQPEAFSRPDLTDVQAQSRTLTLGGWRVGTLTRTGAGQAEILPAASISAALLEALRIAPALGRSFAAADEGPAAAEVALISHALWRRAFAGDPAVLGKTLVLDGRPTSIVGVFPDGFRLPLGDNGAQVLVPLGHDGTGRELWDQRGGYWLKVVGRLAPGVSLQQAQQEMSLLSRALAERFPDQDAKREIRLQQLSSFASGKLRPALLVLLAAVGLVLLIACSNVANLLLARVTVRQRELAVRAALGASRARIVRQLLTESVILALLGGGAGLLLASWGTDALRALAPRDLLQLRELHLDRAMLAFTAATSLGAALLFGLLPALVATRADVHTSLKEGGRALAGGHHRLRAALVAAEIALSVLLLIGAGLLGRSFLHVVQVDPGLRTDGVVTASLVLPKTRYATQKSKDALLDGLSERLRALPSVQAAGPVFPLPLAPMQVSLTYSVGGRAALPATEQPSASIRAVSPGFLKAVRLPLLRGRLFDDRDLATDARVMLVNETLARRTFPGEDPLGKVIHLNGDDDPRGLQIVGVVGDVRSDSLEQPAAAELYATTHNLFLDVVHFALRTGGDLGAAAASLRSELRALDPDLALADVRPYEQVIEGALAARRFNLTLLVAFAAVALVLAAVGTYGVMSYSVSQRTREIGIRMALGAAAGDVLRMVLVEGLRVALVGVGVGLVAALVVMRLLAGMVYGVATTDPLTYAALAALVCGVAAIACWLPARRATSVPPATALEAE